jgi:hypothetical protein
MELIPLLHICWTLFLAIYGFITSKNEVDYYYIIYIYAVALSWTFYNGDCLITYYYNRQTNPSYQAGDYKEHSDLHLILGKKYVPFFKRHHNALVSVIAFVSIISTNIVLVRHHFSYPSLGILLSVYMLYYVSIMAKLNLHALFSVLLLGCLLHINISWK